MSQAQTNRQLFTTQIGRQILENIVVKDAETALRMLRQKRITTHDAVVRLEHAVALMKSH